MLLKMFSIISSLQEFIRNSCFLLLKFQLAQWMKSYVSVIKWEARRRGYWHLNADFISKNILSHARILYIANKQGAASVRSGLSTFQICQFHYFIVVLRHIVPSFYCSSLYLSPCNASPEFQNKRMIEFSMSLLEMCLTEFKSWGLVWRGIWATL